MGRELLTETFKYDPFGRRIYKQSPTATSIFVYDGHNLVETANSSGGEVARYAQGQNIDEPLAMQRGSTVDYYEADGRVAHPFGERVLSFEVSGAASLCRVCKGCVFWFWSGTGDYLGSRSGLQAPSSRY
jgi:hypothetical protein